MRTLLKTIATLVGAVSVVTCMDGPAGPGKASAHKGRAALSLTPVFSKSASETYENLAQFNLAYDRVRIVIVRPAADTVADSTITFRPGSSDVSLDLTVPIVTADESFGATIQYRDSSGVLFEGTATVQSHAPDAPAPPSPRVELKYVGPGAGVARVVVTPKEVSVPTMGTTTFVATAYDETGKEIAGAPFKWTTSDASAATIGRDGALHATERRAALEVTAMTPNGVTDFASVTLVPPAAHVVVIEGDHQTGAAGVALARPVVVEVHGSDGLPVPGAPVLFTAGAGASVGSATATTDAKGRASASFTLGPKVGLQSFAASSDANSVGIEAVAVAGRPASIVAQSGGDQTGATGDALTSPLVAKVVDQFGNAVPAVEVSWTHSARDGALSEITSTTDSSGVASTKYTLSSQPGADTISASVGVGVRPANYLVHAMAVPPGAIVVVSGNAQRGAPESPVAEPLVVKITDSTGKPVRGASVVWTATNGIVAGGVVTGNDGTASAKLTLGTNAGESSVTATASNGRRVVFTATVLAAPAKALVFKRWPLSAIAAGATLAPAVVVEVVDAFGNLASAAAASVSLTLNAPSGSTGATLSGHTSAATANGSAAFSDLAINQTAIGYTLTASAPGLESATSAAFDVIAGAAMRLGVVGTIPTTSVNGSPLGSLAVQVQDATGGVAADSGVAITARILSGPAGTLNGTVVRATSRDGRATFSDLVISGTAGAYVVQFSANGLSAAAVSVSLQPGVIAGLSFTHGGRAPAAWLQNDATFGGGLKLQLVDASGNAVAQANLPVTMSVSQAQSSAPWFTLTTASTDANGVADFSSARVRGLVQHFRLAFTVTPVAGGPAYTVATANDIVLRAGTAHGIARHGITLPAVLARGARMKQRPRVRVTDVDGNVVDSAIVLFTKNRGLFNPLHASSVTTDASGEAEGPEWTMPASDAEDNTVTATVGGLHVEFIVPSSWPTRLKVVQHPQASVANGGFASVILHLRDALDRTIPLAGRSIRAHRGHALALFFAFDGDSSATSDTSGVITYTGLRIDAMAHVGARIAFRSDDAFADDTTDTFTITGGTADTLVEASAITHSTWIGNAFSGGPMVEVRDLHGRNVVSAAGSIVWDTPMVCPAGTAASATTSIGNGQVSAAITVSAGAAGSCTLRASKSGLKGAPTFNLVVRPSSSALYWTGTVDDDWSRGANWNGGSAPDNAGGTDVFVPRVFAGRRPRLTAGGPSATRDLTVENGAQLDVANNVLDVQGNADAAGAVIASGGGSVRFGGAGKTMRGAFPIVVIGQSGCASGTAYSLSGDVTTGKITVNCALAVNGRLLDVSGDLAVSTAGGVVTMVNGADRVVVGGNALFDGKAGTTFLTAGMLEVKGHFTQGSSSGSQTFVASGSHELKLTGSGAQTVHFTSTNSKAYHLTVANTGAIGVTFDASAAIGGTLSAVGGARMRSNAGVTITASSLSTSVGAKMNQVDTVRVTGTSFPAFGDSSAANVVVAGLTTLGAADRTVTGNLRITGDVDVAGRTLVVGGRLVVSGATAHLKMLTATPTNTVIVKGKATFDGASSASAIQVGTLELMNDLEEIGNIANDAFSAGSAGIVKVRFNGSDPSVTQKVIFAHPGYSTSHFDQVEVLNGQAGVEFLTNVDIENDIEVRGKLTIAPTKRLTVKSSKELRVRAGATLLVNSGATLSGGTCKKHTVLADGPLALITGAGAGSLVCLAADLP